MISAAALARGCWGVEGGYARTVHDLMLVAAGRFGNR